MHRGEMVVAITDDRLDDPAEPSSRAQAEGLVEAFGTWEQIFYGQFDGGRRKQVLVKIIKE